MTVEILTSLHNLIKQKLDELNKDRIQRHVQKLASVVKISFVKQTLFQNQNRFLFKINNEVKVRRSIRSVILKKTKMMSYENLEKTRAKRAVKKKVIAGKRKRDHKRKSSTSESELQLNSLKIMTNSSVSKNKVAQTSEVESTKISKASLKVSVTRMY